MLTTLFLSAAIAGQPAEPPQDYAADARAALSDHLARIPVAGRAKNVIVFVGDGLSISTATAARILDGQLRGVDGESNALSFEKFPYTCLLYTSPSPRD